MIDPLIDPKAWEAMKSMTEPEFLRELMDVYLSDSPQLIEQINSGLAAGDVETVRRAAHTLKSNSASFGANRLASAARELEMIARGGTLDGAALKLKSVEAEFIRLLPILTELKNEL